VSHPYAVTPYHPDFLQHADLVETATRAARDGESLDLAVNPIEPRGDAARRLVQRATRSARTPTAPLWRVAVETVDLANLVAPHASDVNGRLGPPWVKEGWFHAYLLLAPTLRDAGAKQQADLLAGRLRSGAYAGLVERVNLERRLVSLLQQGCERVVLGYLTRREPFNVEYSGGVENVAYDAQAGLASATFPRTVKLKDFPWNGWLTVGTPAPAASAWNPVAGFADPTGRLIWAAVGEPALFPSPHGESWIANRVLATPAGGVTATLAVPADAVVPEPGTGILRKVPPGRRATTQVVYRVLTSRFHDGTRMVVADLVYALGFPYRVTEPAVARATVLARERLVGLRVLRVETDVLAFGEDKLTYEVPIVEVFVNHAGTDPTEAALIAPPWTTTPWHVLVLMEEAARRGLAAFSREEAERRGVPWLDLARDEGLKQALAAIVDDFARRGHVPAALTGLVTPSEATARWAALRAFFDAHRHFLVTNGPYRLERWTAAETVLRVFRDLSYPRGVGQFNAHAIPLHAYVTGTEVRGDELILTADVERVERFGRESRVVREPFVKVILERDRRSLPVCWYVVVGPDGEVVSAGTAPAVDPGTFRVELRGGGKPGPHRVLVALTVDDNRTNLPVKMVPWTR
jgi:hypothetical protein